MPECKECDGCSNIKSLEKRLETNEESIKYLSERIGKIEQTTAVFQERLETANKTLTEIKLSIDKIGDKFDEFESRPIKLLWAVLGTVIGALIMAGIKFLN